MNCPHCGHELTKPEIKAITANPNDKRKLTGPVNGRKGGRPRKVKTIES